MILFFRSLDFITHHISSFLCSSHIIFFICSSHTSSFPVAPFFVIQFFVTHHMLLLSVFFISCFHWIGFLSHIFTPSFSGHEICFSTLPTSHHIILTFIVALSLLYFVAASGQFILIYITVGGEKKNNNNIKFILQRGHIVT